MSWMDVVGWGGSALVVWSLLQTRILRLRLYNLAGSLVLMGFNAVLEIWPMVGLNLALAAINVVQLRSLLAHRHDDTTYAVVEVGPDDAYLAHVLATHRADIERFGPVEPSRTPGSLNALVVKGDETVGVVLADLPGDGTAQVRLDYVLPRFRDFTPGEFVYRRSDLFARHQVTRVVAAPGSRADDAYLARVGFRGEPPVLSLPRG